MSDGYDVIVAGHICFDVIPDLRAAGAGFLESFRPGKLIDIGSATTSTGGPVSNTGIGLVKMGVPTGFMGKVGNDFFGHAICERLGELGAAESMTVVDGESTSYTVALAPPSVDRIFLHNRGANNTFGFADVNFEIADKAKLFHVGYPPLMRTLYQNDGEQLTRIFEKAASLGLTTSMDMALPDLAAEAGEADWDGICKRTLPHCRIYLPSAEETMLMLEREQYLAKLEQAAGGDLLEHITPEEVAQLGQKVIDYGAKIAVIKCGHYGIFLRTAKNLTAEDVGRAAPADLGPWSDRQLWHPAFHVESVASATGSGDSAIAGFLSAFMRGLSPEMCLRYGTAAGAFNVMAFDAVSGIKSWDETTAAVEAGWEKNPVHFQQPDQWRFDESAGLYFGPEDPCRG